MGERGPIPNRSSDLARDRSRKGGDQQEVKTGTMRPVRIPEPDEDWHPIALMIWDSLEQSGQSDFYQQTDWAFAYSLCEDLSKYKTAQGVNSKTGELYHKRSPEMLKALMAGFTSLLMTEGDRRRVRVELTEPEPDAKPASVTALADYRDGLAKGASA